MKKRSKVLTFKVIANVCRIVLALTFIFSGFVKANDPFGTVYKFNDYFASMLGIHVSQFIVLTMAISLAFVEFTMGVYLFFGINRKKTSSFTVLFMILMTLLTIYIFIFNPVSDCGCFGDALILSNGATLAKNVVLLAMALFLKRFSKLQMELVRDRFKWLISMAGMIFILAYSVCCIIYLPYIDFRPYKVGVNLRENYESYSDPSNFDVKIVYEKDGKKIELGVDDDDPDSTWTYVETLRNVKNEEKLETSNFYFTDAMTDDDITEDILYNEGTTFLIIIPDLKHADESCVDRINDIFDFSQDNDDASFYCLTGSADEKAYIYWNDHTGAEYDYSIGDDKLLKTIVRGNPGLVIIHDGVIRGKWSNYNLPSAEELKKFVADIK